MTPDSVSPLSARELVLSVASWIEAERIDVTERIVFPIARAAGANFRSTVGRLWLAEPRDRWKGRAKPPRNAQERSRRLLIVAFLAIDRGRGQGRGIVRRSSAAARAAGARFDDRKVDRWLGRFVKVPRRELVRRRNLRQYAAVWEVVRMLELAG